MGMSSVCVARGQFPENTFSQNGYRSYTTSFNVLADSSVDCGENTLFYPILHQNLSLLPCNGSDSTVLPHRLAEKMGLPHNPPFYSQNGSIEGLLGGLNYGSTQATIMNPSRQSHRSLNQQLSQVFETFQLLQLELGEGNADNFIKSFVFYLSFGKDDYIDFFLKNSSGVRAKYSGLKFASILANQMVHVMRNLYNANVRKIICMGILPLGCTPRTVFEWYNGLEFASILANQMVHVMRNLYNANVRKIICMGILPSGCTPRTVFEWYNSTAGDEVKGCVDEINELVLAYNTVMEGRIVKLNTELPDARIIFCDVYQGIMEIMSNPQYYEFYWLN